MADTKTDPSAEQPKIDISIKIAFAPQEELLAPTLCCCYGLSWYLSYPACCGIQQECICLCMEFGASIKCFQFGVKQATTCIQATSHSKCLDLTTDKFVCLDVQEQFSMCFCITGARVCKCDFDNVKMYLSCKGNSLCCDQRCSIPPNDEVVPFGIACCGFPIHPKDVKYGTMG
ncbi:hypothetical protein AAMO2058_001245900 [Amorphochlora amoebiformis]